MEIPCFLPGPTEKQVLNDTVHFLIAHGEIVLLAVVFLEQIGLPLPSMIFLIAAGALVGTGQLDAFRVISLSFLATMVADILWFQLGSKFGTRVLALLCRISFEPDTCVRMAEQTYRRHGLRVLLMSKFVPGLSTVAPPLAGALQLGLRRFLLFDSIGAILWVVVSVAIGYALSDQLEVVAAFLARMGLTLVIGLVVVIVLYVTGKIAWRQWVLHRLMSARITVAQLRDLIESGQAPVVVDLRHELDLATSPGGIPGALRMAPEEVLERHHELPRDREIVTYCS